MFKYTFDGSHYTVSENEKEVYVVRDGERLGPNCKPSTREMKAYQEKAKEYFEQKHGIQE